MAAKFLNFTNVVYDDDTTTSKYAIVKNTNVKKKFSLPKNMKEPSYVYPTEDTKLSCTETFKTLDEYVYTKDVFKMKLQKMKDEVKDFLAEVVNVNRKFIMEEDINDNLSFKVFATGISENEVQFRYDEYFTLADRYVRYGDDDEQIVLLDNRIFTIFSEKTTKTFNLWWEKIDHGIEYKERPKFSIKDIYVREDEEGNPIILTNISNVYNFTEKDGICYNVEPRDIPVEVFFLKKEYPIIPDANVLKATDGSDVVRIDCHNLYDFSAENTTPYDVDLIMRDINIGPDDDLSLRIKEIEGDTSISGIKLPVSTYTQDIEVTKSIEIYGNRAGVSASIGYRCQDGVIDDETVIDGYVKLLGKDCEVLFDGLTFMYNANFKFSGAKKITFRNCRFIALYPNNITRALKSYAFLADDIQHENGTLLVIEDCFFGDTPTVDNCYTYNYFELNCKLADGSTISNNYFTDEVCKNNIINIYDVVEDANIYVENNLFENSANAIRVGIKGAPYATLNIDKNSYNKSATLSAYQGLMLIQPYGKETTSMGNITIDFSNNTCLVPVSHDYYVYYGPNDTQLTKDIQPKVFINGILQ